MPQLPIQANGDPHEPMDLDVHDNDMLEDLPVIDEVNLDLESYICHYQGPPRIHRLEFIADRCRSLRVEALSLAINYIKEFTCNVRDYVRLHRRLLDALAERDGRPSNRPLDTNWIDSRTKQAALRFDRLDSDLKASRSNMIKENIRRNQDDLGDHYLDCGDIDSAFNAYWKSREYALTQRNQISQCLNMIRVSILMKHWSIVTMNVLKAESQPGVENAISSQNPQNQSIPTKLHCAAGLYELHCRKYKKAAKHFLSTNFDHFISSNNSIPNGETSSMRPIGSTQSIASMANMSASVPSSSNQLSNTSGNASFASTGSSGSSLNVSQSGEREASLQSSSQWDILAPVNIALYGSLCALATYSRQELADQLINSPSFKQFSELEPQVRDAVTKFYESKYAACLSILHDLKNIFLLDMYLAPHVECLFRMINNKSLVQYFEPYSTASMHKMALAFNKTVPELEKEIISLICDGYIKARIDSHNKILYARNTNPRTMTFERAIKMGEQWKRQTRVLITRTMIMNAGLMVTNLI